MRIRSIPNKLLSTIGLRVVPVGATQKRFPVELSETDRSVFRYVRDNKLSTSSDERLYANIMACRHVVERRIEGDFVECGVWRGGNSIIAADVFKNAGCDKTTWLFDTFAGMTQSTDEDVNFRGESAHQKFRDTNRGDHSEWCYAPIDEVQGNFRSAGLLGDRVRFVVGDVAKTLAEPRNLPQHISVLRLDTDWYESTRVELEVLYPRLSKGGVLIVDDYGHWSGARKAVDEFFRDRERPFLQYVDPAARLAVKG